MVVPEPGMESTRRRPSWFRTVPHADHAQSHGGGCGVCRSEVHALAIVADLEAEGVGFYVQPDIGELCGSVALDVGEGLLDDAEQIRTHGFRQFGERVEVEPTESRPLRLKSRTKFDAGGQAHLVEHHRPQCAGDVADLSDDLGVQVDQVLQLGVEALGVDVRFALEPRWTMYMPSLRAVSSCPSWS